MVEKNLFLKLQFVLTILFELKTQLQAVASILFSLKKQIQVVAAVLPELIERVQNLEKEMDILSKKQITSIAQIECFPCIDPNGDVRSVADWRDSLEE